MFFCPLYTNSLKKILQQQQNTTWVIISSSQIHHVEEVDLYLFINPRNNITLFPQELYTKHNILIPL